MEGSISVLLSSALLIHFLLVKSLSTFEYVQLNGKDMGMNIRRAETILSLLDAKDNIQEVRDKAAAYHDKRVQFSRWDNTRHPALRRPFLPIVVHPKTYQKQLALKDFDDFDPRETSTAS
ncbi:hypothetical protein MKX03_012548 [Papaver bracteatum]|nr:hypothetical protein MKX03_012548 [Papaver bracteatum]